MKIKILLFFIFLLNLEITAQELPPFHNFHPKDYHGENQNWDITQSSDKIMYTANNKGLLAFNGASWKLHPSPNETIMRSVTAVDDRIYTGCFMEFGYWERNILGILNYTSLSNELNIKLLEDEEFWNIISIDEYVVFQSLKRIYIYNTKEHSATYIDSKSTINKIFKIENSIYFQRLAEGLFIIESGKDRLVSNDDVIMNNEIIQLFGTKNELQILTKHKGLFKLENKILKVNEHFPNTFLTQFSLYDAIQLKDESYMLGSISNGLIHLDQKGKIVWQINQNTRLLNNTVLSLFEDIDNNIWMGLDHGISFINIKAPYRVFHDNQGTLGSVYTAAIFKDKLYLGTNQGLFYKTIDKPNTNDITFIEGTQGQVWNLKVIDQQLFCGHHTGTFIINKGNATKISNIPGTWKMSLLESENSEKEILQGNYNGLYILHKPKKSWQLKHKIKGFKNSARYFEQHKGSIFVNHEYNGIFHLKLNADFTEVKNITIDTSLIGSHSGITSYNDELLYAFKKGVYQYNNEKSTFEKNDFLSEVYKQEDYLSGKMIKDESDSNLWFFTNSDITYVTTKGIANFPKLKHIPIAKEIRDGIVGYENILKIDQNGNYLIGKTSGYITLNTNKITSKKFNIYIESILNSKTNDTATYINKNTSGSFTNAKNNLEISFYAPEFQEYSTTKYQYRLKGIYEKWSPWNTTSKVSYPNLPFGEYQFEVRAKIGNTLSNNTVTYHFTIAKPWYISPIMIGVYILGVLGFSLFMHNVYKKYYKKQRQKLVEKNQRALEFTQVQNEKEIIKLKNEQLELEFKSKSKELAASTMSILKKNKLLTTIKEKLDEVENPRIVQPVIKIIDENLKQNDDWELFQEAFNNADSQFLKHIKKIHPSLSPNDLKLCAYLRLNLSSKEIAQLLHISPRSVEIKRYRLRKKLNLAHKQNLVNYILEL